MNVIGRCKSIDGQKQKPENGCFTGFLASPARFERAAPRLGGECSIHLATETGIQFFGFCPLFGDRSPSA